MEVEESQGGPVEESREEEHHQGGVGEESQAGVGEESQREELVSIPASSHHFCFSLDLRSLTNLLLPQTLSVVLR